MTDAFTELGITPRAYCVLFHAMERERTQAELAVISELDKTTMVVTVDQLEKLGMAKRQPSSTDRRARIIAVTAAGKRAVRQGTEIADRVHREVLEWLDEEDGTLLVAALIRLNEGFLFTPSEPAVRRPRQRRG